jgi:hypothetical protein
MRKITAVAITFLMSIEESSEVTSSLLFPSIWFSVGFGEDLNESEPTTNALLQERLLGAGGFKSQMAKDIIRFF